jgi:exonuclease VII small subunit
VKYELEDILRVRNFRKDKASDNVVKARRQLREAEQKLAEKQEKLRLFIEKKPIFINQVYERIIRRDIQRVGIDDTSFKVKKIEERQMKLALDVEKAQNEVKEAEIHLAQCQETLRQAMKNVQKIEEHKTTWVEEANFIEQELVEKELEDFKTKQPEY